MINRNDQHARKTEDDRAQVTPTGPVDVHELLEVTARLGVPVARFVKGRLELHDPASATRGRVRSGTAHGPRLTSTGAQNSVAQQSSGRVHLRQGSGLSEPESSDTPSVPVLAQPATGAGASSLDLSPRFLPGNAPEAPEVGRSEPEPRDFERDVAASERSRKVLRRRLRRG